MSGIRPSVGVITLLEPDLDKAKEFYLRVFNKQPDFVDDQTANYHFDNLIVNLEWESGSAEQIGELPVAPQAAATGSSSARSLTMSTRRARNSRNGVWQ